MQNLLLGFFFPTNAADHKKNNKSIFPTALMFRRLISVLHNVFIRNEDTGSEWSSRYFYTYSDKVPHFQKLFGSLLLPPTSLFRAVSHSSQYSPHRP